MDFFMQVLSSDITLPMLELANESSSLDVRKILSSNHIIRYKNIGYSNTRAIRQGGTGILFGFGIDGTSILPFGDFDVSRLIVEKMIIPYAVKASLLN